MIRTFASDFPNGMNVSGNIFRSFKELLQWSGSLPWPPIDLQRGNTKLNKDLPDHNVIGWSLPANAQYGENENTCSRAGACAGVCYAKQGMYTFNNVKVRQWLNLAGTFHESFVEYMGEMLSDFVRFTQKKFGHSKIPTLRIHDSGDFLGVGYLHKWFRILEENPKIHGYAYTKRLDLPLYRGKPDNLVIIQSCGGIFDSKIDFDRPHSRIFATEAARDSACYIDGTKTDLPAITGAIKIGLVYHGTRKLNESQKRFFDRIGSR